MSQRNPSPPPEIDENEDCKHDLVGSTAINKKWIYKLLMDMIQELDKHREDKENEMLDISDDLETDCCNLWDLCTDEDIALFIGENEGIKIIAGVILESKAPRLTEICVGILGNLACFDESCKSMTDMEEIRKLVLLLLSNPDPPTLIETMRLLQTVLSNKTTQKSWISAIKESESFYNDMKYILSNSTNTKLLINAHCVIEICFDVSDHILNTWSTKEFIASIIESGEQVLKDSTFAIDKPFGIGPCLHALQSITMNEDMKFDMPVEKLHNICMAVCELWLKCEESVLSDALTEETFTTSHVAIGSLLALLSDVDEIKKQFIDKDKESTLNRLKERIENVYKNETIEEIKDNGENTNGKQFILDIIKRLSNKNTTLENNNAEATT